ncbi:MAG: CopD family protein [Sideroxydans sp.]
MNVLILLHMLAAVLWVGGMFFAYVVLRPAAVEMLEPPHRLRLWDGVFRRFFGWVWGAIGLILLTGLYLIYQYGGLAHSPHHVHVMLLLGLLMMVIYGYVFFACYIPFNLAVSHGRWKEAGEVLGKIRRLVALNLALGVITLAVAETGVLWG